MHGRGTLGTIVVLAVLAVSAGALAHSAPEPLENEVHVLEDDGRDELYYYDGYDLHHLHVREAVDPVTDEHGLIFRFTLYGGFAPTEDSDALHIDLEAEGADGAETVRWTTEDDRNWTASAGRVVVADVTPVDDPKYPGVTAAMQTFVPYETFGVGPGDTIGSISMYSLADDDLRDASPGGIYVPNSGGQAEVPSPDSTRHTDEIELAGPHGYIDVEAQANGSTVQVAVDNQLANGQHVTVEPVDTAGWEAGEASQASLDANGTETFALEAEASPNATEPLPVRVATDLGGEELVHLGVDGEELVPASTQDEAPVEPAAAEPEETPAPSALLVGVALLGAAGVARRRAA